MENAVSACDGCISWKSNKYKEKVGVVSFEMLFVYLEEEKNDTVCVC